MASHLSKNNIVNTLKVYIFPSLVSMLAMMIWRDVSELRSDVKQLLSESAVNKTKIDRLEKQVEFLNQAVFKYPKTTSSADSYKNKMSLNNLYAKHEDFFDINLYLQKNT